MTRIGYIVLFVLLLAGSSAFAQEMELGPLFEPDPVAFSFDTPGWYTMASLSCIVICYFSYRWIRRYIKNGYRRVAHKYLKNIEERYLDKQEVACLIDVMTLLKHVALSSFGRENVASLHGNEWLFFLESTCQQTPFSNYSELISNSLYKSQLADASKFSELVEVSKKWIRNHA